MNPLEPTVLKWDVVQTYADGLVVEWTGPVDSSTPASLTSVGVEDAGPTSGGSGTLLGGAALLIALVSLGLTLRPSSPARA